MAIAFDTAVDGLKTSTGTLQWNHTCTGSNLLLLVAFNGDNIGGADDITGVTYNSVAMTLLKKITTATGGDRYTYIYGLLGPATGTHQVSITAGSAHLLQGGSASYTGVLQSGLPDASTTSVSSTGATTWTTSLTSIADNCWMFLIENCYEGGAGPGAGTGSTRRTFDGTDGGWGIFDNNAAIHPAASNSMTTTLGSNPFGLAIIHVAITFAPAGAAPVTSFPSSPNRALAVLLTL